MGPPPMRPNCRPGTIGAFGYNIAAIPGAAMAFYSVFVVAQQPATALLRKHDARGSCGIVDLACRVPKPPPVGRSQSDRI